MFLLLNRVSCLLLFSHNLKTQFIFLGFDPKRGFVFLLFAMVLYLKTCFVFLGFGFVTRFVPLGTFILNRVLY